MIQESDVEQWLAIRKEAGLKINPKTAEVDAQTLDPQWRLSRSARGMPASWTGILRPIPGKRHMGPLSRPAGGDPRCAVGVSLSNTKFVALPHSGEVNFTRGVETIERPRSAAKRRHFCRTTVFFARLVALNRRIPTPPQCQIDPLQHDVMDF